MNSQHHQCHVSSKAELQETFILFCFVKMKVVLNVLCIWIYSSVLELCSFFFLILSGTVLTFYQFGKEIIIMTFFFVSYE